jgi:hypothetical protein
MNSSKFGCTVAGGPDFFVIVGGAAVGADGQQLFDFWSFRSTPDDQDALRNTIIFNIPFMDMK